MEKWIWAVLGVLVLLMILVTVNTEANGKRKLTVLPEQFIVFDLETTGLNPESCEIIEIGAIFINRDSVEHTTFQAFVTPSIPIPKKITQINGIS